MIIGYKNNAPQKITIKKPCQGYYLRWYYNGWHYWFFLPGKLSLITEGEKYRTIGTRSVMMGTGQITYEQCQAIRTIINTREIYVLTADGWKNVHIEPGSLIVYGNQGNGYDIELAVKIGSKEISITGFSPIADVPIVPIPDPGLCEVIIGTQVWMCKNYDSDFPGSKVYNNDEANRAIYGGLYTWNQIMSSGFCPAGWHIPTLAEWQTLIDYIGDNTDAGGILKEVGTQHWNAGIDGTDDYSFKVLGAGSFLSAFNFYGLKDISNIWAIDPSDATKNWFVSLFYNRIDLTVSYLTIPNAYYFSVRLIKDTPAPITYDDWFLFSEDELEAFYQFYLINPDPFVNVVYGSSTEASATMYRVIDFATGIHSSIDKSTPARILPIRSFIGSGFSVGDYGQSGGLIFYIDGTTCYEIISSSATRQFSDVDTLAIGTTSTAIGTGQANTTAIIGQIGHTDTDIAAEFCNNFVIVH